MFTIFLQLSKSHLCRCWKEKLLGLIFDSLLPLLPYIQPISRSYLFAILTISNIFPRATITFCFDIVRAWNLSPCCIFSRISLYFLHIAFSDLLYWFALFVIFWLCYPLRGCKFQESGDIGYRVSSVEHIIVPATSCAFNAYLLNKLIPFYADWKYGSQSS